MSSIAVIEVFYGKTRPVDTGHLEAFERAARTGSFSRAADALFLTQPSISARIAVLEECPGSVLFERGGHTLKLTTAGKIFLPSVERALTAMAVSLLIEGEGVAFLPENFVQQHIDAGRLVFLEIADIPPLYDDLLLLSAASRDLDKPALAFIELFRQTWQHLLVD